MNVEAVENIVLEKSIKKFVKGLAKSESVTIFNSYSKGIQEIIVLDAIKRGFLSIDSTGA